MQWFGSAVGTVRWIVLQPARALLVIGLPLATAVVLARGAPTWVVAILATFWIAVPVALAFRNAKDRLIVGIFEAADEVRIGADHTIATVDIADLLRVEVARLADLLRVVDDRRAVSSGLIEESFLDVERDDDSGPRISTALVLHSALDATLSVDQLSEALQGAISDQAKFNIGPLTVSLAPLIQLMGRVLQSPRITGHLHQDGERLILTARLTRQRSLTWRVERDLAALGSTGSTGATAADGDEDGAQPVVVALVRELALRIYTDLSLEPTVRWEASEHFFEGLRQFRSCLRSPRGRKVNLRRAEACFLEALAEDEDYPSAHYNLGVLYTELLGLASAAGHRCEADLHRSAAEVSFGRAIEQDPERWDCHFAFAQIQLRNRRYPAVVEACRYMLKRDLTRCQEVRTRELAARAHLAAGRTATAIREARTASALALWVLVVDRIRRRSLRSRADERARASGRVAAACLLTYGTCYLTSDRAWPDARGQSRPALGHVTRTMRRLIGLSRLGDSRAALQHYFGRWAMIAGQLALADEQLSEAAGSMPTRAAFAADLALARARGQVARSNAASLAELDSARRDTIVSSARRALQAMSGTFSPTHDDRVCDTLAEVYGLLGRDDDVAVAADLTTIAQSIRAALHSETESASGLFVQLSRNTRVAAHIGAYARSAQRAYDLLHTAKRQRTAAATSPISSDADQHRAAMATVPVLRDALVEAGQARSLNPLSTFAWETLGDIHAELSDFSNARRAWTHALRTDPDNARLYAKLASSYWNIAYEGGRTRPKPGDLRCAINHFEDALTLYGSDNLDAQTLTRYRLVKLHSAARNLDDARRHLQIVEAFAGENDPPLVGWVMFGLACLGRQVFTEAEYYFRDVITEGQRLADRRLEPTTILGKHLDERMWPLSLTRAWGHLGLVLSWLERGAIPQLIEHELDNAEARLRDLYSDEEDPARHPIFPTRAKATALEGRARLALPTDVDTAIARFEDAITQYPFSRAYLGLAWALEELADEDPTAAPRHRTRAETLVRHGLVLGQWRDPPDEAKRVLERLRQPKNGGMH